MRGDFVWPVAMLMAAGCSSHAGPWESRPVFPVEGRVLIKGKAAEGVEVTFHPTDAAQQSRPKGVTDAEGKFRLRTNADGDGAPAGEYVVTLYWPDRPKPKPKDEAKGPPDRFGKRFLDPKQSPYRATVSEGGTVVPPFEVQ